MNDMGLSLFLFISFFVHIHDTLMAFIVVDLSFLLTLHLLVFIYMMLL